MSYSPKVIYEIHPHEQHFCRGSVLCPRRRGRSTIDVVFQGIILAAKRVVRCLEGSPNGRFYCIIGSNHFSIHLRCTVILSYVISSPPLILTENIYSFLHQKHVLSPIVNVQRTSIESDDKVHSV